MSSPLFRTEAVQAQGAHWLGGIVLATPLSHRLWAWAGAVTLLALLALLGLGQYARRVTVAGELMPAAGLTRVVAPGAGVLAEQWVREGQAVRKGQALLLIDGDLPDAGRTDGPALHARLSGQVRQRMASIDAQLSSLERLHAQEQAEGRARLDTLAQEDAQLADLIGAQQQRVGLAQARQQRQARLVKDGFMSPESLQQFEAEVLDQRMRQAEVQRQRQALKTQRQELQRQGTESRIRHDTQVGELQRERLLAEQDLAQSDARRQLKVLAPLDGTVSALTLQPGQAVRTEQHLLTLVPAGAQAPAMQVHLYAPSRAIGFVQPGAEVRLRYPAYPYQKYGQGLGRVRSLSLAPLDSTELAARGPAAAAGEPLYRVVVELADNALVSQGRRWPLQAGMVVEADLVQESRRLVEWMLEPLLGLRQRTGT